VNKFAVGVAGSVVAAVIGYFLIAPGGLLNPDPPTRGAEARITAFNGPNYSSVGQVPVRDFTVYNGGESAAEMCSIFWNPFGPDPQVADSVLSLQFTLKAGDTRDIQIQGDRVYDKPTLFDEGASVFCQGGDYRSPVVTRVVNTYPQGG
jgi:hypothetical protein